jgi:transcriptional regulator GlxA family with amidase domain
MKHISILALEGSTMTSLDGTYQLFSRINDFLRYRGQPSFYKVEIVGGAEEILLSEGLYKIQVHKKIDEIEKTSLIIIPIICGDFEQMIKANRPFVQWIKKQYDFGAEIASLCVGSFFLASTGLLDGKKCAIHWASKNEFQLLYPTIEVLEGSIITDENGIYTSGGTYSYLNLLLHIIEKHLGREMSVLASKMFEIDIERKSQSQFAIFMGQKRHDDLEVLKAQDFIEENPDRILAFDEVCLKFGVGRRTFERRFKKATGNSFIEYMQRVKVEAVKKELEIGRKTVNELVYKVGYNDITAFRKVFKKYVGMSPIDYRNKYKVQFFIS